MKTEEVNEILSCLVGGRTVFHYYQDRYAVYLLDRYLAEQGDLPIRDLRAGAQAKLLNRPLLKELITRRGSGRLCRDDLRVLWPAKTPAYVLTLGSWGQKSEYAWAQTSRPGSNLVLQLNLSQAWARKMHRLLDNPLNEYMGYCHPLSATRGATLAWARLDVDMRSGVVLIEEIQSDLIKELKYLARSAQNALGRNQATVDLWLCDKPVSAKKLMLTAQRLLLEIEKVWQEAMLTAAIWFSFEELGMKEIYFHTFETGCVLKNLRHSKPPRSLYTQVPERFCFEQTCNGPEFLVSDKHARRRLKKVKDPSWFVKAA